MNVVTISFLNTEEIVMKLWKHEITRVIADRFINDNDKEWFNAEVMSLVKTHLGPDCQQTIVDKQYFVDFLRGT